MDQLFLLPKILEPRKFMGSEMKMRGSLEGEDGEHYTC